MPLRKPILTLAALTLLAGCDPAAADTSWESFQFAKNEAPQLQAPVPTSPCGARLNRWAGVMAEG